MTSTWRAPERYPPPRTSGPKGTFLLWGNRGHFYFGLTPSAKTYKDVRVVSPCEGTGYEIGSMSLIHGARHPDEAKQFYNWG